MTATVNYTVAYNGDFTAYRTATLPASIGSDFTASSSGLTQTSSSTTIALAASETLDFTGHPVTVGGVTRLIGAYNNTTKVGTLSAKAGYSGTWPSTPGSGSAYTVADIAVVVTIGQSAAGNNLWLDSGGDWTISGITLNKTVNTLTINGATAPNALLPLRFNANGDPAQPVAIHSPTVGATSAGFLILSLGTAAKVTFNNLQIFCDSFARGAAVQDAAGVIGGGSTYIFNSCWLQAFDPYTNQPVNCPGGIFNNCWIGANFSSTGLAVGFGAVYNGCTLFGFSIDGTTRGAAYAAAYGAVLNECLALGCVALSNPASFSGYGPGATWTRGFADLSGAGTVITAAAAIILQNGQLESDSRSLAGSTMIAGAGAPPSGAVDYYGVTRNATNSSAGMMEAGVVLPALKAISWDVNYAGAVPDIAPNGSVSAFNWSGGVATLTIGTHGLTVGRTYQFTIWNNTDTSGYFGLFNALIVDATHISYPVASSPTAPAHPATWLCYLLNTLMGAAGGAADLTYFQSGAAAVCSGTAADSSHIVLAASTSASVIGHPVQYQSGNICIIGDYDPATHIATVIPPPTGSLYAANFGTVPQNGQPYTIFPVSIEFAVGESASANRYWNKAIVGGTASSYGNAGAINFGPARTSPTHTVTLRGTALYSRFAPLGAPANNGSAIAIANIGDHTAVLGIGCDHLFLTQIQLVCLNSGAEDGCLLAMPGGGNVTMTNCVLHGESGTDDQAHTPWFGQSSDNCSDIVATNCVFVASDFRNVSGGQFGVNLTTKFCIFASSCNAVTTLTAGATNGDTTLHVASVTGLSIGDITHAGSFVVNANVAETANVVGISGTGPYVVTLQNGTVTGTIANGAPMQFANMAWANLQQAGAHTMNSQSTAFFGIGRPVPVSPTVATYDHCATDSTAISAAGMTSGVSYSDSITAGSGAFKVVPIDCQTPITSPLRGAGLYDAAVPLDIFGQTRPNPPAIGPAEYPVPNNPHTALMLMGVG